MRKGQITILVLLLGLMGLTVALSSASRSLSDLKQVSYVDFGTKAFAAAEAGLQYGLNQASIPGGVLSGTVPGLGMTVDYQVDTSTGNVIVIPLVIVDNVTQLDLSTINAANTKFLDIFWQGTGQIEAIVLDKDNLIRRFAFNGNGTSEHGFSPGISTSDISNCPSSCLAGYSGYTSCTGISVDFQSNDKLLRIKALTNSTPVLVCALTAGKSQVNNIPVPIVTVTATATTANNTVKKVQAVKTPPTMPAIFDYVLFSNSSISK